MQRYGKKMDQEVFEPTDDVEKGECLTIDRLKSKRTRYGTAYLVVMK
jgi:hypothetical protein